MPWSCCGQRLNDDVTECPGCGAGNGNWTMRFQATRTFKIGRSPALEVGLLSEEGEPVASEPWEIVPPKGRERTGELDAAGSTKLAGLPPGTCLVRFPSRGAGEVGVRTLALELRDADGLPVAGEPYVVTFADGKRREGALDARGQALLGGTPPGRARVQFPRRDPAEVTTRARAREEAVRALALALRAAKGARPPAGASLTSGGSSSRS